MAGRAVAARSEHKCSCSREKGLSGSLWGEQWAVGPGAEGAHPRVLSVEMPSIFLLKINVLK